jgi:hypothetical protein
MPDGIDAMVDPMEPSARHSALDHSVRKPDFEQLRYRHNTVLTGSEGGDREVQRTSPGANGLKSTYTVDFLPLAG